MFWDDMFNLLDKDNNRLIVISERAGSSYVVITSGFSGGNENQEVLYASESSISDSESLDDYLNSLVQEYSLLRARCSVMMRAGSYSHFLVNKPMVSAKEMEDAIKWLTKDIVKDLPYDNPLLTCFPSSSLLSGTEKNKLHVIVAEEHTVAAYKNLILKHNMKLDTMAIEDLAIVKMTQNYSQDCIAAFVSLFPNGRNFVVFSLNKQFIGVKRLPMVPLNEDSVVQQEKFELLWDELQQHINYYSKHIKKEYPCNVILSAKSWEEYASCMNLLQSSFENRFSYPIIRFDAKNKFYDGPLSDKLNNQDNIVLLGVY